MSWLNIECRYRHLMQSQYRHQQAAHLSIPGHQPIIEDRGMVCFTHCVVSLTERF